MNSISKAETTALSVIQRASLALGAADHEKKLIALAAQSKGIVTITNPASYQECHGARMALKNERIAISKIGKDARDDAIKFSKAIIAEEGRLIGLIEPEETRLQTIQDAHDAKIEAEKAAKAEAERLRILTITGRIAGIKETPFLYASHTSEELANDIIRLHSLYIDDSFAEFYGVATDAKAETLAKLEAMRDSKAAEETEAARVKAESEAEEVRMKAEREELDRQRAEQDAQRAELARQQKELDDKLAVQAEIERQQAEQKRIAQAWNESLALAIEYDAREKSVEESRKAIAAVPEPALVILDTAHPSPVSAPVFTQPAHDINLAAIDTGATMNAGEINRKLGFLVSTEFLASLGFQPKHEKNAKLYRESDFPRICVAIISHIETVADIRRAAER